jgi:hypothetical protein
VLPYGVGPAEQVIIAEQVEEMLQNGIVTEFIIISPWASPVVMVDKQDGTKRFCVDSKP